VVRRDAAQKPHADRTVLNRPGPASASHTGNKVMVESANNMPSDHRGVELAAESIGRKAQEPLCCLPERQQTFNLDTVAPGHWWLL
jgi:hypothetical protein